jgi:chondroitin-sulfate-ABC endolyase/exolyase
MMRLTRTLLLACWALAWMAAGACALDSFEEDAAGWRSTGGTILISDEHWKLGKHSLRWDFSPGATLCREADAAMNAALAAREGGVKLWLYCERPVHGALRFQIGPWVFPVNLGFTGWRAAWVHFREDAQKAAPIVGLQITAPDSGGTLFVDAVEFGPVDWSRQGDAQTPFTHPHPNGFTAQDHAAVPPPAPARAMSEQDAGAFREIARRYEEWMFGRLDDPRAPVRTRLGSVQSYINVGHKAFEQLGLVRHGNVVSGPGAFCEKDSLQPHLARAVLREIALPLAYDARLNRSERARQRFLDLIDYAHDQGWAAGSLMGTSYGGEQLQIAGYVHAVYILRDFLREQGRLTRELETLRYHLSVGGTYRVPDHPGANADDVRSVLLFRLLYVLMLDDSPEKLRDMECFVRWANAALAIAPGYGDTLKPDGTVFHHATAYECAYGNDALLMASLTYWLLHGTRFELEHETGGNLKQALLALRFMGGQYDVPMGVSGRWPFSGPRLVEIVPAFAYMADALNDAELGAAYARLWNPAAAVVQRLWASCGAHIYWSDSPGALPWLLDAAEKYRPEPHPQGHRVYPFAAMNFHRRHRWVASVRGWSRYVWNYEDLPGENRYGRYSSDGMMQIFSRGEPVSAEASGYREAGWDWLRPPGATVIRVPLESLPTTQDRLRIYTRDPFVGGVALEGRQGVWAMRFADPLYEPSFRFRKSVFFVDDTLVCLGSGIANTDAVHATETVLYQTALPARPPSFPVTGQQRVPWLMDPVGNGYFFPEPQVVETRVWHQQSMDNGGRRQTGGDFSVAWLDHGRAPGNAGYAYAIRPDTTDNAMERYASAPDFVVLRRDDTAHIVRFAGQKITGYVLFGAVEGLTHDVLNGADSPCLVMTRQQGDRLIFVVADPDLRLGQQTMAHVRAAYEPGKEGRLRLGLNGAWNLEAGPGNVRAVNDRVFEIICRNGESYEFILKPK